MTREAPRVLFVCGSNSCRSQMAEGLLRARAGDSIHVESAGTSAGGVHPLSVRVMSEAGHDISGQRSKAIGELEPVPYDLVITLCGAAHEACIAPGLLGRDEQVRLFAGVPVLLHWPVPDPAAAEGSEDQVLGAFRDARDEIDRRLADLLDGGYLDAFQRERGRLQRFADLLDDGIVIHDHRRIFFLVNDAALKLTGYTREQVIGSDCHSLFPPHGICGESCQFRDGAPRPTERREYTTSLVTGQSERKRLKMSTEPFEVEPGLAGVLAVIRDNTEIDDLKDSLGRRREFHGMVGSSQAVLEVFDTIRAVSASDYPVLITGESGTGKELVAAAIHNESSRRGGPLVPVNCGALPENILESELFGHVRGAFTGAIRDKKGRFELAHQGTLFLDEVGELPPSFQVKLLRAIQEKRFERVGGERQITVDVRIVAATNRDLRRMVTDGTFREDLFYRLCVVPIDLPPLRDRREDVPPLVEQILERVNEESGKRVERVERAAMDLLLGHRWPGNVRELINALQFASLCSRDNVIRARDLPPELRPDGAIPAARLIANPAPAVSDVPDTGLADGDVVVSPAPDRAAAPSRGGRRTKLTRAAVDEALARAGGNKVKAAKLLGVGRATLYRFLGKQG